jgi:hypothetical protein
MGTKLETPKHTPEATAEAIAVLLETPGLPAALYDSLTDHVIDLLSRSRFVSTELVRSSYAQLYRQAAPDPVRDR